jgi:hypothetical protein
MAIRRWRALGALTMAAGMVAVTPTSAGADEAGVGGWSRARHACSVTVLGSPEDQFFPWQINNRGQILGTRIIENRREITLYDRGRFVQLPVPPGEELENFLLNERGDVAVTTLRWEGEDDARYTSILWSDGKAVDLGRARHAAVVGLNDGGQLLVNLTPSPGDPGGPALWDRGQLFQPHPPPGRQLFLRTLSHDGVAGGEVSTPRGQEAVIWRPGEDLTTVAPPPDEGGRSRVVAITSQGVAVGERQRLGGPVRLFAWHPSTGLADLGSPTPDIEHTLRILEVNDRGDMLVSSTPDVPTPQHQILWLWRNGGWTPIDVGIPEVTRVALGRGRKALNDRGQVILTISRPSAAPHGTEEAVLWQDGHVRNLDALAGGTQRTLAWAINDRGWVTLTRHEETNVHTGLLWRPGLRRHG